MGVRLNVPLVTQQRRNSCWYASACMVAYFREAGPRLGLPDKWKQNKGIQIPDFIKLAQVEGLKAVPGSMSNLSEQQLETFLRSFGPLWCAGHWDGLGHIVVLTGADGGKVYINDPNPAKRRRVETLAWFNQKLDSFIPNSVMYKP